MNKISINTLANETIMRDEAKADGIAAKLNADADNGDEYKVEIKGYGFVVALYADGEFVLNL